MKINRNLLSDAVRYSLAAGAVSVAGLSAAPAFAQEEATLDRIEVTGTRIKRVDSETSQPVFSMSREDIKAQGLTSVADVIQNITSHGSALNSTFNTVVTVKPASTCVTWAQRAPWCWSMAVAGRPVRVSAVPST